MFLIFKIALIGMHYYVIIGIIRRAKIKMFSPLEMRNQVSLILGVFCYQGL